MTNNLLEFAYEFNWYGISIALGVVSAVVVLYLYSRKRNINPAFVDLCFYIGAGAIAIGFFSAHVFQSLYSYIADPTKNFKWHFQHAGITFLGGLLGGALFFLLVYFLLRKFSKGKLRNLVYSANLSQVVTIIAICIVIAHAFGRIGCFFAPCCYGAPTDFFLGYDFEVDFDINNPFLVVKRHPTMLYESFFLFVLFAVMTVLYYKYDYDKNLNIYFIAYGIFRFLAEYLRGDERGEFLFNLSPSQFWSIVMFLIGVALYVIPIIKKKLNAKKELSTK